MRARGRESKTEGDKKREMDREWDGPIHRGREREKKRGSERV